VEFQRYFQRVPAQFVLAFGGLIALAPGSFCQQATGPRFYPDDPICCTPRPVNIPSIESRKTDMLFDFIYNTWARPPVTSAPSGAVNTLGEALDSEWFTNRHGRRRMTAPELKQGPGENRPPQPPFTVVGAKLDGVTPGFRMRDVNNRLYFVKPDPLSNPEMATASDAIGSRFFYALGYNTPENYLIQIRPDQIKIGKDATRVGDSGKPRPMSMKDIEAILWKMPRTGDGTYRMLASLAVDGKPLGPFRYEKARTDDPNDLVPHEQRRDLRGLFVFCAWLNHTDAKSINSLDALVESNGVKFVRHYLIDFGALFGSDSDMPKNARFGNAYVIPTGSEVAHGILDLGLKPKAWEKAKNPHIKAIGRFNAEAFDPEAWVSNYPNQAFEQRSPEDEYWAAKQVMAFTDADIRALVETGKYSDPQATEYLTKTLSTRRDKIGRAFFSNVLPLDEFTVANGNLEFVDLAARYNFFPPRKYVVKWFGFDNQTGQLQGALSGSETNTLPPAWASLAEGGYIAAQITAGGATDSTKSVRVFLRKSRGEGKVVGIERTWAPRVSQQQTKSAANKKG
jgi:hypothetical protein